MYTLHALDHHRDTLAEPDTHSRQRVAPTGSLQLAQSGQQNTRTAGAQGMAHRNGATVGVHTPKFYQTLGTAAEFVYGATQWEPELVNLRAGGLIPIEREYPGARDFVAAYKKEFPGKPFSHLTTAAYSACRLLVDAIKRAGSLEGDEIRKVVLAMDTNTPYGAFRVDAGGLQVAHKMMWFQWQDGKKVIVWPTEITPEKPRFPTPQWDQR